MSKLLRMLARATDTKGYPDDKDPAHWRTIHHAKVHLDASGHVDGGAGKKFDGAEWTSIKHPHRPETYEKPKGAEDLKKAWAAVAKERMEVRRARTEASRKRHEEKLEKAYKEYTDMRAEIEARDPAEAAKFKPRTAGSVTSPKKTGLSELAEATTPELSFYAKTFADGGIEAVKHYAAFKKSGKAEDLEKAQKALESATADMKFIADPEEAKVARDLIIDECKKLGLESGKLRDLFKEIKEAVAPEPTTGTESPLAGLAEATAPVFPRTTEEISAMRARTPLLKEYEVARDKVVPELYKRGGLTEKEKQEFEKGLKKIFDASAYGMHIDAETMHFVFDSWFKSQPEIIYDTKITKKSGGATGEEALRGRADIWTLLLGRKTSVGEEDAKTREKYGFLCAGDPKIYDETARWYGDCLVRFKKDRLKGRVTYTFGDSLGFPRTEKECKFRTVAGDADNPSIAGIHPESIGGCKFTFLDAAKKESLSYLTRAAGAYCELQYFGDLTVDDIDSFSFGCAKSQVDMKLVKKLKSKGIKVYCLYRKGDTRCREI